MTDSRESGATLGTSQRTIRLAVQGGVAGAIVTLLAQLLIIPVVLIQLGPSLYGAWLVLSAIVAVGSLADAGIRTEVARRVAAAHGAGRSADISRIANEAVSLLLVILTPAALLGIIAAPALCELLIVDHLDGYSAADLALILRVLLAVMLVNLALGTHFTVLKGLQRSDADAFAQVAGVILNAGATLAGLVAGLELWALLVGTLVGSAGIVLIQATYARQLAVAIPFRLTRINRRIAVGYLSLSTLALVAQVADVVDSQWDKFVISRFVGSDAVTTFHVGTSLLLQAKAIALLPVLPLLVAVAELRGRVSGQAPALQTRLMKWGAIANGVIVGGSFAFAPSFITLWLGEGYEQSGDVARLFAFTVLLTLAFAPISLQALAEGLHRACAWSALSNMGVNLLLSLVLTMHVGLLGAVYGSIAGTVVGVVVCYALTRRKLSYWIRPPVAALAISALAVSTVIATSLDDQSTWIGLVAAALAYAAIVGCVSVLVEGLRLTKTSKPSTPVQKRNP